MNHLPAMWNITRPKTQPCINRIVDFFKSKFCSRRIVSVACPPVLMAAQPFQKCLITEISLETFVEKSGYLHQHIFNKEDSITNVKAYQRHFIQSNFIGILSDKVHHDLFPGTNIRRLTHIPISNSAHVGAPEMPFAIDTCGERISRGCYLDRFSVLRYFLIFKNILKNIYEKFPLFFSTLLNFPIPEPERETGNGVKDHKLPVLIH